MRQTPGRESRSHEYGDQVQEEVNIPIRVSAVLVGYGG